MNALAKALENRWPESIKILKVEEGYLNEYGTFKEAYRNIWNIIENVYNRKSGVNPR